jgi:hypothetical protein
MPPQEYLIHIVQSSTAPYVELSRHVFEPGVSPYELAGQIATIKRDGKSGEAVVLQLSLRPIGQPAGRSEALEAQDLNGLHLGFRDGALSATRLYGNTRTDYAHHDFDLLELAFCLLAYARGHVRLKPVAARLKDSLPEMKARMDEILSQFPEVKQATADARDAATPPSWAVTMLRKFGWQPGALVNMQGEMFTKQGRLVRVGAADASFIETGGTVEDVLLSDRDRFSALARA